jgi:hypothetical protein
MLKHIRCHGDTGKVKKSDVVIDRLLGKRTSLKLWVRARGSKTREWTRASPFLRVLLNFESYSQEKAREISHLGY